MIRLLGGHCSWTFCCSVIGWPSLRSVLEGGVKGGSVPDMPKNRGAKK